MKKLQIGSHTRSDSHDDARPLTAGGGACLDATAVATAAARATARVRTDHSRHHWRGGGSGRGEGEEGNGGGRRRGKKEGYPATDIIGV